MLSEMSCPSLTRLQAMKSQLTELYYAFALAYTSSRILVLPRMTCFCIQNW